MRLAVPTAVRCALPTRFGLLVAMLACVLVVMSTPRSDAAGRRSYGGTLTVAVTELTGLVDPARLETPTQRLLASLTHCRLFRTRGGVAVPELASSLGSTKRGVFTIGIRPARFHGGARVKPSDVVASLRRLKALGKRSSLGDAFDALTFEASKRRIMVRGPAGVEADELRALLARAEAAIIQKGMPGKGRACGAFKADAQGGSRRVLKAFNGHPEGRPWVGKVELVQKTKTDDARDMFVFGDADLTAVDHASTRRVGQPVSAAFSSYVAVTHPSLSDASAREVRRGMAALAKSARLGRFVDAKTVTGGLWPDAIAPNTSPPPGPGDVPPLAGLTIVYPEGDTELEGMALALRDALRPMVTGTSRALPVKGLGIGGLPSRSDRTWDLALTRHDWAATTPSMAVHEVGVAFGGQTLSGADLVRRRYKRAAAGLVDQVAFIPLVHVTRPWLVRPGVDIHEATPGVPNVADAWRQP